MRSASQRSLASYAPVRVHVYKHICHGSYTYTAHMSWLIYVYQHICHDSYRVRAWCRSCAAMRSASQRSFASSASFSRPVASSAACRGKRVALQVEFATNQLLYQSNELLYKSNSQRIALQIEFATLFRLQLLLFAPRRLIRRLLQQLYSLLNLRTATSQKCAAVPRRARI